MSEQDLVRACIDKLREGGCDVWRQNQGAMKTKTHFIRFSHRKGISDIIGFTAGGSFVAVECKRGRNKPTPDQAQFIADVVEAGGFGVVVWSVDELIVKWNEWATAALAAREGV